MLTTKKGFRRDAREIPVNSLAEAHARARKDLEKMYASGATSENWCFVVIEDGKTVAYVSWNGRMWEGDPRGWTPETREIV